MHVQEHLVADSSIFSIINSVGWPNTLTLKGILFRGLYQVEMFQSFGFFVQHRTKLITMLDVVESVQTLLFPVNIPLLVETYTIKPIYYVDSAS